jgi:hypothetical protein
LRQRHRGGFCQAPGETGAARRSRVRSGHDLCATTARGAPRQARHSPTTRKVMVGCQRNRGSRRPLGPSPIAGQARHDAEWVADILMLFSPLLPRLAT